MSFANSRTYIKSIQQLNDTQELEINSIDTTILTLNTTITALQTKLRQVDILLADLGKFKEKTEEYLRALSATYELRNTLTNEDYIYAKGS